MIRFFLFALVVLQPCLSQVNKNINQRTRFDNSSEIESFMKTFKSARLFPLCIKESHLPADGLSSHVLDHFKDFLGQLNKTNNNRNDTDPVDHDHIRMRLKSISLNRINVPVLGAYNLRQWMHITFDFSLLLKPPPGDPKLELKLDFLLIQPVASPLGLPFGEFRNDIECSDDDSNTLLGTPTDIFMVPCTYRPRSAIRHPHVLVAHDVNGFTHIHINFNWINSICQDVIAMQFLILYHIIGETDYKTAITPAILLTEKDSLDGVPYTFYRGWQKSEVRCHGSSHPNLLEPGEKTEPIPAKIDACVFRIVYNHEFDKCIEDDTGLSPDKKTCPPGPFYCEKDIIDSTRRNKRIKDPPAIIQATDIKTYMEALSKSWAYCPVFEGGAEEECFTINRIKIIETCFKMEHTSFDQVEQTVSLNQIGRNQHGLYMLVMLFCHTLSLYYARYFKEAGKKGILGIRCWLWGHLFLTFISTVFMWLGAAKYTGESVGVHGFMGYLAAFMYHANILIGFVRPMKEQKRATCIISHMVTGYMSQLILVLTGCVTDSCKAILLYIIGSQIIIAVFYIGVTYSPIIASGDPKLNRMRKQLPVPETLEPVPFTRVMKVLIVIPLPIFLIMLIGAVINYRSYAISTEDDPSTVCKF